MTNPPPTRSDHTATTLAALAAPAALAIPPAPAAGARRVPVPLLGRLGEARLGEGMLGRADEDVALVPVAVEEAQVLRGMRSWLGFVLG